MKTHESRLKSIRADGIEILARLLLARLVLLELSNECLF